MFVSAGVDLKFHNVPEEISDLTYTPLKSGNIKAISWSKDNCFLTFVSEDAKPEIVSLKNLDNIKNVHTISAVTGVSTLSFERTTKRFIGIATHSGQVSLYDTKNKAINRLFETAPGPINVLDFNMDDKQMAISCINGSILLYDTKKTNVREIYNISSTSYATTMKFHSTEPHLIAIGTEDGNVLQWDVDMGQNLLFTQIHSNAITGLVLMENSQSLVTVGSDHKFCIYNVNSGANVFRNNLPHPLTAVDISHNNFSVAVGDVLGNIYVYDTRQLMVPLTVMKPHKTKVNKILFEHKIVDDFDDHLSKVHSACYVNIGDNINCEVKCEKQQTDSSDKKCSAETPFTVKCTLENIPKTIQDKKNEGEPIIINNLKEEVASSIYKSVEDLRVHIMQQIGNLQNVITNEFHMLEEQMEEKWNLLNMTLASSKDLDSMDIIQ